MTCIWQQVDMISFLINSVQEKNCWRTSHPANNHHHQLDPVNEYAKRWNGCQIISIVWLTPRFRFFELFQPFIRMSLIRLLALQQGFDNNEQIICGFMFKKNVRFGGNIISMPLIRESLPKLWLLKIYFESKDWGWVNEYDASQQNVVIVLFSAFLHFFHFILWQDEPVIWF